MTMERIKDWAAEFMTAGFALGVIALALVLFVVWALYDLFTQPDERM